MKPRLISKMGLVILVWMGMNWIRILSAHADCLELKNDGFDQQAKPQVVAIRSFCISENFGAIFQAPEDILIQKIRVLISGDGKRVMENTVLNLSIFKETTAGGVTPGEQLVKELEYSPPGAISQPTPQWLDIEKVDVSIKKGERFRVVFSHDTIDCENRVEGKPLCAESCQWWSATADANPTKPKTNVAEGQMFACPALTTRAWRFWEDFPTECRPSGNLILRVMGATSTGKDCLNSGTLPGGDCNPGETRACACTDGKTGSQSCTANRSWGICSNCTGGTSGGSCTPGDSKSCACTTGQTGAQTCNAAGTAWETCKCDGSANSPVVTQVTPNKGPVNQNIAITVIGQNFTEGAKVIIGVVSANDVRVLGNSSVSATIPAAIQPGTYDVIVENKDGKRGILPKGFTIEGGCGCTTLAGEPQQIPASLLLWIGFFLFLVQQKRRIHA